MRTEGFSFFRVFLSFVSFVVSTRIVSAQSEAPYETGTEQT